MSSMRLAFVGTGVSCAVPVIGHVDLSIAATEATYMPPCSCTDAVLHPEGPSRRSNVSLLISLLPSSVAEETTSTTTTAHILVDAGKTFREAYFRVLAPLQIGRIDALLLTHGHADAMHCVEEVCDWQAEVRGGGGGGAVTSAAATTSGSATAALDGLVTFLTRKTAEEVASISPGLMARSRWVATSSSGTISEHAEGEAEAEAGHCGPMHLAMHELSEDTICRLPLDPLLRSHPSSASDAAAACEPFPLFSVPVEHGSGYISMAFVFGAGIAFRSQGATAESVDGKTCVVYISDVSEIPAASMQFLQDLVKIDVLVFDLLAEKGSHSPSHTCWDDVMPFIRALTPCRTYFVGMFCSLYHHPANADWVRHLAEEKDKVRAALPLARAAGDADVERMEAFLTRVQSLELAYDGQQLVMPR